MYNSLCISDPKTNYWELRILFEVQELAKICETAASLKPPIATVYTLSNNQKYGKTHTQKIKHVEPHLKKHNATCSVGKNMSPFDFTFFSTERKGGNITFWIYFFWESSAKNKCNISDFQTAKKSDWQITILKM